VTVREAVLSMVGRIFPIVVMIGVIAMLMRQSVIIVVGSVLVVRSVVFVLMMRVVVLVLVLVESVAKRVVLDPMMMRTRSFVKRHVHRRQHLEADDPKHAGQHGTDTNGALSRMVAHGRRLTVATFPWPINQRW
jgi:hypothetical protein